MGWNDDTGYSEYEFVCVECKELTHCNVDRGHDAVCFWCEDELRKQGYVD